ncbi:cytochrome c1 [Ophidiomyces ophidiicola]|nr:cytochrome c1 [Ophidiomyces ophidiicola]KAI2001296.1 cytochrome c1 [Ophidiomyces ophidiicola]KAI2004063.1 cytochrome c1 [Ophidiomyces ophidiicola]KAI2010698.1 cytochrome c1 [Ophidiomyces ophidiicola]KAI2129559.1 cytochrome c1 [Ophidiomyces ophidiicola]
MGLSLPAAQTPPPILHVEVRIKEAVGNVIVRTDIVRNEASKWLLDNFAALQVGQEISTFEGFNGEYAQYLETVRVVECTGTQTESGTYLVCEVSLDVQAYQLHQPGLNVLSQEQDHTGETDDDEPHIRILPLPSKELDGIWESLFFEQPIHSSLLRAVARMLAFAWHKLNTWTINWNRLILLYGPPGTGKTSLCRALAQKLAIRLGKQFPQSRLIEINANSLSSKFFGESGKRVTKLFATIEALLTEEPDTLICVFIDEVESLTAKREKSLNGNDPLDAMRAVNALLTALDRLRHYSNVVVFCASNLITALDSAFLDRIDIKQLVPAPSVKERYEIFRSCFENLSECGLIKGCTFDVAQRDADNPESPLEFVCQPAERLAFPRYEMVLWYQLFPESSPKRLGDLAQASERSSSSKASSVSETPFYLTLTASAATAATIGAAAWYYHLYGPELHAMTPAEEGLHSTAYPWEHTKFYRTFDHAALRRGFQVYREVCAQCHSLTRVPWRSFVGTMHTVDEMKAMAEEHEYDTEPNDQGEIEKRPGKLSDYIPAPYKNDEAARAANSGALPPDLSLIVKARHGGCDYIFNLLTGYPDEPPAGASVQEGLNFNPYFPGTGIAMARVLFDGMVEYEDGTPSTTSQMAKDVTEFLNWAAEPEMDDRKKMGLKTLVIAGTLFAISVWVKRYKWAPIKTRQIVHTPPIGKRR